VRQFDKIGTSSFFYLYEGGTPGPFLCLFGRDAVGFATSRHPVFKGGWGGGSGFFWLGRSRREIFFTSREGVHKRGDFSTSAGGGFLRKDAMIVQIDGDMDG
jgi:hypothetical protein